MRSNSVGRTVRGVEGVGDLERQPQRSSRACGGITFIVEYLQSMPLYTMMG